MSSQSLQFNTIIDNIYRMSIEDKEELRNLLEHNIAENRRDVILKNYKQSQKEQASGTLQFSSNISELKNLL